jgi:5,8-dihydroxy-2-naphthoate synthase
MRSTSRRRRRPAERRRVAAKRPQTIHLAHSPDADDAFMFWALAAGRIDTGDRRYVHELGDIESLNRRALAGELEVTAVSLHAYAYLADRYALLAHGASIGDGYGPRIVARAPRPADPRTVLGTGSVVVAVPGELTTAFLALKLYQPAARHVVVPFDQIEDHVAAGRADAGLLIHEGQLTYADRGLRLWVDLGAWWHDETRLPLPLGGNVVRRDLGDALMQHIARDLKASIQYGLAHRAEALAHATAYSRGLDPSLTDRFVGMYVNAYTVDYGPTGRQAVAELLGRAYRAGLLAAPVRVTFVAAAS